MRQTDSNIREWMTGLMRSARLLLPLAMMLRSAMMLTVAVVAVLTVVSCSGAGDDPEPQPTPGTTPGRPDAPDAELPILFTAHGQENTDVTRAETPLETKVKEFTVYGFKNTNAENSDYAFCQSVFPGYIVEWLENSAFTTTSNTDGWEYILTSYPDQTLKYWDYNASAYRFFGVAKGTADYTIEEIKENNQPKDFKISFRADASTEAGVAAVPYYSTLWFSNGKPNEYQERQFGKPVKLVFLKPFARVRFMFTQSYPDAVLMLDDKHFAPSSGTIVTAADFTITYPLKGSSIQEVSALANVSGITDFKEDYSDTNKRWYDVIAPQSLGAFTLRLKINGVEKTAVVPAEYMDWKPGYEYTYVFKITEQGGVEIDLVESAFTPWNSMDIDHSVNNW